jgi:hypothetical protein
LISLPTGKGRAAAPGGTWNSSASIRIRSLHQELSGMSAVTHFMNFDLLRIVREHRAFVDAD